VGLAHADHARVPVLQQWHCCRCYSAQ
jgi:hypothetical protein